MTTASENRLAQAASAYLRSARHQPVQWHEWNDEAFALAQREDKPVLLDIGAVWCHWCHVMDRESYEDQDTAALINDLFVPVKVDRDERPDVDTRYQAAVAAISGQGGWPLTAFLTPAGKPFFGGTYFPPEDRYGRPSFARVLRSMAAAYRSQRAEVEESGASVLQAIESNESFSEAGELNQALLDKMLDSILNQFDGRNGGFGGEPKFPHAAALDLLLDAATRPGPHAERAHRAAEVTLERMAAGGIHDQLAGGFHRYSVDERWVVPHFEKMAYDNSELLRVYTHGFETFVDPNLARVAGRTLHWMDVCLSDREHGGFYASQDADASLDDDGDYFTWTRAEAEAALSPAEFAVADAYFHLQPVGHMHHNPAKNVLHVIARPDQIAARLHMDEEQVSAILSSVCEKLSAVRQQRKTPYIDRTIYTGWNGLCISAYLAAGRALALPEAVMFALKSLQRVLGSAWDPDRGLARVVAYGESADAPVRRIPGVLDDYAFLATAVLDAWEATGDIQFFRTAQAIADAMIARFYDETEGGFFDTEHHGREQAIGALIARRKPLQDAPTPAGNAVAAALLLRLHGLTSDEKYLRRARTTLALFAGVAEHLGLYAASYGQALRRFLAPPVQVCIIGEDNAAEDLAATATARFELNKSVVRLRRDQLGDLPPALAETLPHLPGLDRGSVAVVCRGVSCMPPVTDEEELLRLVTEEL